MSEVQIIKTATVLINSTAGIAEASALLVRTGTVLITLPRSTATGGSKIGKTAIVLIKNKRRFRTKTMTSDY